MKDLCEGRSHSHLLSAQRGSFCVTERFSNGSPAQRGDSLEGLIRFRTRMTRAGVNDLSPCRLDLESLGKFMCCGWTQNSFGILHSVGASLKS